MAIYAFLVAILYLASPFMVSWGGKLAWYLSVIAFMQVTPFNLIRENGEIMMHLILINALFWTLLIAALFYIIARLLSNENTFTP